MSEIEKQVEQYEKGAKQAKEAALEAENNALSEKVAQLTAEQLQKLGDKISIKKIGRLIPLEHIPKIYSIMKWTLLVVIAVSTAVVGFLQSMLVSELYKLRSNFLYKVVEGGASMFIKFLQYTAFNLVLAFLCCLSLYVISPAASGSGIPDVKAFLNGVESPIFKNFFRIRTFVAKVIGSALAVSASLVMGKEGPMLHAGSILAVILGSNKWMQQQMEIAAHWGVYTYNKELRDLVAMGAACGVTTAFKAPVGGVLFAMEMSTRWRQELTWWAFMACAITYMAIKELNQLCVDKKHCSQLPYGSLIWYQMTLPTPYTQVWAVVLLALCTGYLGSLYTSFNTWVCLVRKKWAKHMWAKIAEVCAISVATSIIFFLLSAAGSCQTCTMPAEHEDGYRSDQPCLPGLRFKPYRWWHCQDDKHFNDLAMLVYNPQGFVIQALFTSPNGTFAMGTLIMYAIAYWVMAAITYGAFIPSGLFTPSLVFGGCVGRIFAKVLVAIGAAQDKHVGMYSLLGAAGFLGGLMRMSAAQALILMEMTQAPNQLPFLMLTLVLSKNVGDHFNYSVFDHQMMLKGLQFVGIDEAKAKKSKLQARDVMSSNTRNSTLYLVESGSVLQSALEVNKELGAFPVTTIPESEDAPGNFVGLISRKNVEELLDKHGVECETIQLASRVEVAPIIIPTNMPLPFVYRVVNAEGFNYVPVIRTHGPLEGIVSRTELVDVQNKKLDEFHLKDTINQMSDELDQGKLIGSMNLTGNIHAARFKAFWQNPVAATKNYLAADDKPQEETNTFYVEPEGEGDALLSGAAGRSADGAGPTREGEQDDAPGHDSEKQPLTGKTLRSSHDLTGPGRV